MQQLIKINGIKLNYEILGEGDTILFLHGFGLHLESLKYASEPLFKNKNYKRVYLDLPGMGKSSYSDEIKNSTDILTIVNKFIKAIIKEDPFSIVGHSYGGYLARGVLHTLPNQVKGMALICPVIVPNYMDRNLPEHKVTFMDETYLSTLDEETVEDLGFLVRKDKTTIERTIKEIFEPMADNEEFLIRIKDNGYGFDYDIDKAIDNYSNPILFLLGKHDSVTGYEDAFRILKHYPNSSFVVLDNAGHNLHIEQAELFDQHIKFWLHNITGPQS